MMLRVTLNPMKVGPSRGGLKGLQNRAAREVRGDRGEGGEGLVRQF